MHYNLKLGNERLDIQVGKQWQYKSVLYLSAHKFSIKTHLSREGQDTPRRTRVYTHTHTQLLFIS